MAGLIIILRKKTFLLHLIFYRRAEAGSRIYAIRIILSIDNLQAITKRRQDEDETEPNSEYSLIYKKSFEQKGHDLIAEVKYLDYWESSNQLFTQYSFHPMVRSMLQKPDSNLVKR